MSLEVPMSLKIAIQMDHISTVNIAGDTTFALSLEAQARGHHLFHLTPDRLSLDNGKVIILGTGWGGFNAALNVRKDVPISVVSPSNHFVFTPLLPSTAVGTLEFRCIQEPVR